MATSPYHTGVPMQHTFRWPKGVTSLANKRELSREARLRLAFLEYAQTHSVAATCRHFGIATSTFYRWHQRFHPTRLQSLENRSSRPHTTRRPTWTTQQAIAVRELRKRYPYLGKEKLAVVLNQGQGLSLSVSMVGRILSHLKRTSQIHEPARHPWRPHSRHQRPYAIRKPKDYEATHPGSLIQLDTMELRPLPTVTRFQFTAVDTVSRESVVDVYSTASAKLATEFLDRLVAGMSSPVRAIQVDGGSEFMAQFEDTCRAKGIRLFALPPRSPKLNGCVERTNRTYRHEFYECYDGGLDLPSLRRALYDFQHAYNHHRPHQALGYLTPYAYLQARQL